MLYLDQPQNRRIFMAVSIIATGTSMAVLVPGINAVGIFMVVATINILVYYALPDKYSKAYREKHSYRFHWPQRAGIVRTRLSNQSSKRDVLSSTNVHAF